jgi:hypothetical protein
MSIRRKTTAKTNSPERAQIASDRQGGGVHIEAERIEDRGGWLHPTSAGFDPFPSAVCIVGSRAASAEVSMRIRLVRA